MYLHVRSHERATKKVKRSINEARGKGRRFSSLSAPLAFHPGKPGQPDGALRAAASSRAREALSTRSSTPTPVRLWSLKTAQLGTTTPQPRSPGQDRLVQKSSSSICLPALPSPAHTCHDAKPQLWAAFWLHGLYLAVPPRCPCLPLLSSACLTLPTGGCWAACLAKQGCAQAPRSSLLRKAAAAPCKATLLPRNL